MFYSTFNLQLKTPITTSSDDRDTEAPHLQQAHERRHIAGALPKQRAEQRREDGHIAGGQRGRPRLYQLSKDLEHVRVELLHVLLYQRSATALRRRQEGTWTLRWWMGGGQPGIILKLG